MINGPSDVDVRIGSGDGAGGASVGSDKSSVGDALASGGDVLDSVTAGGEDVDSLTDGIGGDSGACEGGAGGGSATTEDDEGTGSSASDVDGSGVAEEIGAGEGTGSGNGKALDASGAPVGSESGFGVTVVYCVMITTGGGGGGGTAVESIGAAVERLLDSKTAFELDCSTGRLSCPSVGAAVAKGAFDEDSNPVRDGDGKIVVYCVSVTYTLEVVSSTPDSDAEGALGFIELLELAVGIGTAIELGITVGAEV